MQSLAFQKVGGGIFQEQLRRKRGWGRSPEPQRSGDAGRNGYDRPMPNNKAPEAPAHDPINAHAEVASASPRSFAFLLAAVLAAYALFPLLRQQPPAHYWALVLAPFLLLVGWLAPALLSAPTKWWLALGDVLSKVAAPLSMFVVFFGVITAYGCLLRLLRRDVLQLKRNPAASSYWCDRSGDAPVQFNRQF